MVRLYSLSYSEFFYSFSCFFVLYSVIYHCFPPATYLGPFPFFVPLFVPVQYFPSIFFDPFHQLLPLCIFHLGFSFPIPLLLFPNSCSSFSYSPVEVPSQEYTIFSIFFLCILLLPVLVAFFISLFLFSFCPLTFSFVLFTFLFTFSLYSFSTVRLLFFSPSSKNISLVYLLSHINHSPFICIFLYPIFTLLPRSLSSLATS
jgi:hypothetical protein